MKSQIPKPKSQNPTQAGRTTPLTSGESRYLVWGLGWTVGVWDLGFGLWDLPASND